MSKKLYLMVGNLSQKLFVLPKNGVIYISFSLEKKNEISTTAVA